MADKVKNMVSYIRSGFYVIAVLLSLLVIMGLDQCVFEGCDCEDEIQDFLNEKGELIDFELLESGVANQHTKQRNADQMAILLNTELRPLPRGFEVHNHTAAVARKTANKTNAKRGGTICESRITLSLV